MGPAAEARGPVGTLGRSGMECLMSCLGRSRERFIWSTIRFGAG